MTPNQKRNIKLHIEELVLDGVSSREKNHVASVVRRELHQLINHGGLPSKFSRTNDIPQLDGGTIRMEHEATKKSKGIKIARNLYRGLRK